MRIWRPFRQDCFANGQAELCVVREALAPPFDNAAKNIACRTSDDATPNDLLSKAHVGFCPTTIGLSISVA
jgi:hypothetical protein